MTRDPQFRLKVGLKYCGGCNPEYDRVTLVKQMERELQDVVEFVAPDTEGIDLILAVQGCRTACADLTSFRGLKIRTITRIKDAEVFVKEVNKLILTCHHS